MRPASPNSPSGKAGQFHTFNTSEPQAPSRYRLFKKKPDEEYNREYAQYEKDVRVWRQEKERFDARVATMDYQWRRTVIARQSAAVKGILRLVRLNDKGAVEWNQECSGTSSSQNEFRSDLVVVRGRDGRPNSIDSPAARANCTTDEMRNAGRNAVQSVIEILSSEAWLSSGNELAPQEVEPDSKGSAHSAPSTEAPREIASSGPCVAAIVGDTVFLNVGVREGLRFNQVVTVVLASKEVRDPGTNELLKVVATERVNLRVTGGTRSAECVALTDEDKSKLSRIQRGMSVSWQPLPKPAPARPPFSPLPKPAAKPAPKTTPAPKPTLKKN